VATGAVRGGSTEGNLVTPDRRETPRLLLDMDQRIIWASRTSPEKNRMVAGDGGEGAPYTIFTPPSLLPKKHRRFGYCSASLHADPEDIEIWALVHADGDFMENCYSRERAFGGHTGLLSGMGYKTQPCVGNGGGWQIAVTPVDKHFFPMLLCPRDRFVWTGCPNTTTSPMT
jgi:hypothetical protein